MRLLLIDDHEMFSHSLKFLLQEMDNTLQITLCENVSKALSLPGEFELILLDMDLPGVHGIEGLALIKAHHENTPVVIVSGDESVTTIERAIETGAMGYILKSSHPNVLLRALKSVLQGHGHIPAHALNREHHNAWDDISAPTTPRLHGIDELSSRQRMVLQKVAQGKSNKVIARELDISENTVKAHLGTIFKILEVSSRTEAVFKTAGMFDDTTRTHSMPLEHGHNEANSP